MHLLDSGMALKATAALGVSFRQRLIDAITGWTSDFRALKLPRD
jgi:hypothetical protein